MKITVKQNYFEAHGKFWQQKDGTPMGSQISNFLAKIFLKL